MGRTLELPALFRTVGFLVAVAVIIGCGASLPGYYDRLDYRTEADLPTTQPEAATTKAFYVTNRNRVGHSFGTQPAQQMTYGECTLSVPRNHIVGNDLITLELSRARGRASKHLRVEKIGFANTDVEFFESLAKALSPPRKDLVIFVHGYNSSFKGAVSRVSEFVYDLGDKMVPLGFCWVSQGRTEAYFQDEDNTDAGGRSLADLLERILDAAPDARLHVVAHSMGARVTTMALQHLKSRRNFDGKRPIANLVFAAPDINSTEFASRMRDDHLVDLAQRTTLYVAWNDRALQLSQLVHGRTFARAGRAGENVIVLPGMDTVDVSLNDASIVGHGYFGDNRAVIHDLHMLITLDQPPAARNLYHAEKAGLRYWLIRP